MTVRAWFWSMLSKGDAPEPDADPDRLVEVTVVPYPRSQLTVALLARNGLDAVAVEQSRIPSKAPATDSASICVRARDVAAANQVLRDNG
jgi:hypothetical protein